VRPIVVPNCPALPGDVALETQLMWRSVKYLVLPPSDLNVLVVLHSPVPIQLPSEFCDPEMPSALPGFVLAVSVISDQLLRERTVGGTSLAALRPGFFLGGRTQVLLKAPFEMTSTGDPSGIDEEAFEGSEYVGRGASGVTSGRLILDSGEAKTGRTVTKLSIEQIGFADYIMNT
jgi:hypothetical protein